jgi:hypothetical protein
MKILALATEYPDFLRWLHAQTRGLVELPHEEQVPVGAQSLLGGSLLSQKSAKWGGRFFALIGLQRLRYCRCLKVASAGFVTQRSVIG